MDNEELKTLEDKLVNDNLNDEQIKRLFSEIKKLKKKLQEYMDILESNQEARESITNIFMFTLDEENKTIEVPTRIIKNMLSVKTNDHLALKEGLDFTMQRSQDADTYILDFSNYIMDTRGVFNEEESDCILIYYNAEII